VVNAATIVSAFEHAGYRRTAPRRALAELVASRNGYFTADGLLAESRRRRLGVTRATVFRSLDVLSDLGFVERLDLPSGEHAYVACEPVHHHHVVCSSCGRSTPVEDAGLERLAEAVGRTTGFLVETHRLELFGLCPSCRPAAVRADARDEARG